MWSSRSRSSGHSSAFSPAVVFGYLSTWGGGQPRLLPALVVLLPCRFCTFCLPCRTALLRWSKVQNFLLNLPRRWTTWSVTPGEAPTTKPKNVIAFSDCMDGPFVRWSPRCRSRCRQRSPPLGSWHNSPTYQSARPWWLLRWRPDQCHWLGPAPLSWSLWCVWLPGPCQLTWQSLYHLHTWRRERPDRPQPQGHSRDLKGAEAVLFRSDAAAGWGYDIRG